MGMSSGARHLAAQTWMRATKGGVLKLVEIR